MNDQSIEKLKKEFQEKHDQLRLKYENDLRNQRYAFISILLLIFTIYFSSFINFNIKGKENHVNQIKNDVKSHQKSIEIHLFNQPDHITPKQFINYLNQNRDSLEFVETNSDSILIVIMALSSRITESIEKEKILSLIQGKKKVGFAFLRISSTCKGLSSYRSEIQSFIDQLQLDIPMKGFELVVSINSRIFSCHKNIENLIKYFI